MLTKPFRPSDERLASWQLSREEWARRRSENDRKYFEVPAGRRYRVVIDGATHETFSDDPIVITALRAGTATSERRLAATVRQLTLAIVEATLGDGSIERLSQIQTEQPGIARTVERPRDEMSPRRRFVSDVPWLWVAPFA
jgi:hypothetical protein